MQWLETNFLGYLDEWDSSVHNCPGFTPAEMKKMQLSSETLAGLKVTGMLKYHKLDIGLSSLYLAHLCM